DAKKLMEAVEKRFSRNAATKKTKRNLLKQKYDNFTAPSSEMLDQNFEKLQKLVSQLELLEEKLSQKDVNQKLLRSLSPKWNTHVVVWRNKVDLDTMSMDDLYNNLKVYEPEVKGMSSSINTAYEVSTAITQVNVAYSTNIYNLSDAVICSFFASQPNSSQLVHKDLEQILPDDMEEIDLRWQMAMECRALRNQDNKNKESLRRSVIIETSTSITLVSCDGLGGYDFPPTYIGNFMPPTTDLSFTNLYKFVNKRVVENNKAKYSEEKTKVVKKNDDAPIIKEWMSDNEEEDVSQPKIEKKTIRPSNAKIEFVKSKQQEKTARKIIKQVEQHRKNTQKPLEYSIVEQGYEKKTCILGIKASDNADTKISHDDGSKPSSDNGKKVDEDKRKENECNDQEKEDNVNSTNNVNTVSSTVNDVGTNEDNELLFDPNMPALEDASTFYFSSNNEDDGAVADINNLDTTVQVSPILTLRIHKDHPLDQVIEDLQSATQTKKITQKDNSCIERSKLNRGYTGRASTIQVTRSLKFSGFTKWKKGYRNELCNAFERLIHEKFQMSSIREQTQKPLLKDEDGEEMDVHMYRSMIGSLMYLTSSRPDIVFVVYACARYQVNPNISHLHVMKRIFKYLKGQPKLGLWYPKDSPFDLVAYTDSDYSGASLDMMSTIGGCQFLGCRLIS
nr:putative ribonuclease H-like domain-containing protein [Tanacetum cinerariifolium]